jgi:REP element-mobilizing transposase RayT
MDKFSKKYRIESNRFRNWDYGTSALYFITACTKNRIPYFGRIVDGKLQLSEIGDMVKYTWEKTYELRPDMNLWMGENTVMPDHFHAIIGIGKNEFNTNTNNITDTNTADPAANAFGPQSKNLASILRGFKSSVTIRARAINPEFAWHPRFHDRIIWSFSAYERISNYIINNPANWQDDDPNQK